MKQRTPIYVEPGTPPCFPDPADYPREGLVAVGGDMDADRLRLAYDMGIFPWYSEPGLPLWWSPEPRAVLTPEGLHVSRRLQRRLLQGGFELTWNRAFRDVIVECSREREDGTWIHPEVIEGYCRLHETGDAHSVEVWQGRTLVGGMYGVQRGGAFAAESKFHRRPDMSKVALVAGLRSLHRAGIELFDVQHNSDYLRTLGVTDWERSRFLEVLARVLRKKVDLTELELDWR